MQNVKEDLTVQLNDARSIFKDMSLVFLGTDGLFHNFRASCQDIASTRGATAYTPSFSLSLVSTHLKDVPLFQLCPQCPIDAKEELYRNLLKLENIILNSQSFSVSHLYAQLSLSLRSVPAWLLGIKPGLNFLDALQDLTKRIEKEYQKVVLPDSDLVLLSPIQVAYVQTAAAKDTLHLTKQYLQGRLSLTTCEHSPVIVPTRAFTFARFRAPLLNADPEKVCETATRLFYDGISPYDALHTAVALEGGRA